MVSGATIRAALAAVGAVGGQMRSFDELAAGANDALRQAPPGLTASGAASFLADKAQESDYFRVTEEYAKNGRYAPYIGRGFQMITWRENYAAFGAWCRSRGLIADANQFVNNPKSLADYRWAWLSGVWYFQSTNLWGWANAGDHLRVSQAVNGGRGRAGTSFVPNHWSVRKRMFDAFRAQGNALLPTGGPAPAAPAAVPPPPPPPRRTRSEDQEMPPIRTAMPPTDEKGNITTPKWDWPTDRAILAFEPNGTPTGKVLIKLDHGGRGGWVHLIRWWIRDPNWTANIPRHFNQDHKLGASQGHAGSERFVGYGWVVYPPAGADFVEVVTSAPDGAQLQAVYH